MLSYLVAILRNSARAQQSASLITCEAGHDAFPSPVSACSPQRPISTFRTLIANPRLESRLSSNHPSQLQISNRERMAISSLPRRPALFRLSLATRHWLVLRRPKANEGSLANVFLIVTPRLEFPASPTKQDSNPTSNRYKSPFFAPCSTGHPSLAPVAPTSRKAIMCRNHFTQIPRSKPLMRKVTYADTNQS
jgi:hypothetical protein